MVRCVEQWVFIDLLLNYEAVIEYFSNAIKKIHFLGEWLFSLDERGVVTSCS
jgi:hypothetical protein